MKLHILHTNDLHGHLENWDILSSYIDNRREEIKKAGNPVFLCDVGDALDTYHPLVEATQGEVMIDLFNQLNYDVVTIGNNEGLNFTSNQLRKLYKNAAYEVVCANVLDKDRQDYPVWAQNYSIKRVGEYRVAFIGLTAPYATYELNNYDLIDSYDALQTQLNKIFSQQEPIHYIVLLSHLGLREDRLIARRFPELNLILGAHTHHVLHQGEEIESVLLAACGRYGEYVGEVIVDLENKQHSASLKSIEQMQKITNKELSKEAARQGRKILKHHPVADLPHPYYSGQDSGEKSYSKMVLEAMSSFTGCDLAMVTTGLFLSDLPAGIINQDDLHQSLPHPIHIAELNLTGFYLIQLLNEIDGQLDDLEFKFISGSGFRGKVFGQVKYKGIRFDTQKQEWLVNNQSINLHGRYRLAALDHYWFLPFFPTINYHGNPKLLFPEFIRHIVADFLAEKYPVKN